MARYYGIGPRAIDDVVIGIEKIEECVEDIRPLHALHYRETETLYKSEEIKPDYARYIAQEKAGLFVLLTVRVHGEMKGYLMYHLHHSLHSESITAFEDAFFLHADCRGRGLASDVIEFAERVLKQLGVKYAGMSDKSPAGGPDLSRLMGKHGYKPVAIYYSKELSTDVLQ